MAALLAPAAPANPIAFLWGDNGQMLTPEQADAKSRIAQAIIANAPTPQNVGEGIGAVGKAIVARKYMADAGAATAAGRTQASQDIQAVLADPTKAADFLAKDPYATDAQSEIAKAILAQQMQKSAPGFDLDQRYKEAQIANMQHETDKPYFTSSFDTGIYDPATKDVTPIQADSNVVNNIVSGIEGGNLVPNFSGMSRQVAAAVQAKLASDGFNAAGAAIDFKGAEHGAIAANGSPQLRLRQAETTVDGALNLAGNLGSAWSSLGLSGPYTQINRASLEAAKRGLLNGISPNAQTVATQLDAQINDIAAEIATVYKGGGTPTNEDLAQARTQLDAAMANGTLNDMIANVRANMNVRRTSTPQAAVGQNGAVNRYAGQPSAKPAEAAPAAAPVYARNPKTGQRLQLVDGAWVPAQ